jgi:hypothetical protein
MAKCNNRISVKFTCDRVVYLKFEAIVNQISEKLPSFLKVDAIAISKISEECFRIGVNEMFKKSKEPIGNGSKLKKF